jgi:hypothetical protein
MKTVWLSGMCAFTLAASSASATLIPNAISGVTAIGSATGDGVDPNDGSQSRVVDGSGLTVGSAAPSSWVHANSWQTGWQHKAATTGSFILDFGSVKSNLDTLYIWNVAESGATNRGAKDIQVYYATAPTVTPVKNAVIDFSSGGWTSISSITLTQAAGNNADPFNGSVSLLGVPSARYVGIRMINNYGGGDVGLAETEVTQVPEPAGLAALGIAAALIGRRRRRH